MIGNVEAIDGAITSLKENRLVLKIVEGLQDYLSCKIKFSMDKKRAWLGQPHLIENLIKNVVIAQRMFRVKNFRFA